MRAEADVTAAGLLGIAVLVSGVLLSTSVLVSTATGHRAKARLARRHD